MNRKINRIGKRIGKLIVYECNDLTTYSERGIISVFGVRNLTLNRLIVRKIIQYFVIQYKSYCNFILLTKRKVINVFFMQSGLV